MQSNVAKVELKAVCIEKRFAGVSVSANVLCFMCYG